MARSEHSAAGGPVSRDWRPPILYPITDRRLAGGRPLVEIVRLLGEGGAELVQIREKALPDRELVDAVRECASVPGVRILVNDRPDVALVAGAAGVHLGDRDLPAPEARDLMGPGALIGVSTHSVEEAVAACDLPVDYVALGPIFATSNAAVQREPLGPDAIGRASRRMKLPLVAIGGITLERAPELIEAGAASLAVVSDVMAAPGIPERVRAYLRLRRPGR